MSAIAADSTSGVGCAVAPGTPNDAGDHGDQVDPEVRSSPGSRDTGRMSSSFGSGSSVSRGGRSARRRTRSAASSTSANGSMAG